MRIVINSYRYSYQAWLRFQLFMTTWWNILS